MGKWVLINEDAYSTNQGGWSHPPRGAATSCMGCIRGAQFNKSMWSAHSAHEQILKGYGITIDRGTLGAWVTRVAWWLEPLYHRLLTFIRSQQRVFCDDTPLPQLEPGRLLKVCQLWAQAIDDRPFTPYSRSENTRRLPSRLAGEPAYTEPDSRSPNTRERAPTTVPSPIETPGTTNTSDANQHSDPIVILPHTYLKSNRV